jgi:predicted dithiol-disulfide oxidoreductase (DUF899 family)
MKFSHFPLRNKEEEELIALEGEFIKLQQRWVELHRRMPRQSVENYSLATLSGSVRLGDLFGDHRELMVVHNMGVRCAYCTLWADGFNGIVQHLESKAAFVVASPDDPETQRKFALDRSWKFRMVSHAGSSFSEDLGFKYKDGTESAGVSILTKGDGDQIYRVTRTGFCPGDLYSSIWHLFDLLPSSAKDRFAPKFRYFDGKNTESHRT